MSEHNFLLEQTANIVAAFVGHNKVEASELGSIIRQTHAALQQSADPEAAMKNVRQKPAVAVGKSVFDEYIICLEDGGKFKSLKRHLRAKYDISPEEYRQKWGLPANYPMVAPAYARTRSALAKQIGLGQSRKKKK